MLSCRWQAWLKQLKSDLVMKKLYDAALWRKHVLDITSRWTSDLQTSFPVDPAGNASHISGQLFAKWGPMIELKTAALSKPHSLDIHMLDGTHLTAV